MTIANKHVYEFGRFCLDAEERLLLRDGQPVSLTPKAFDVLLALVQHSGRLLQKEELMQEIWHDSFVEEGNLAFQISILRRTLGKEQNGQAYIETVPKRGYRFIAQVRELSGDAAELAREQVRPGTLSEGDEMLGAARGWSATRRSLIRPAIVVALAALLVPAAWLFSRHRANLRRASDSVARVEGLTRSGKYFEAYDLAVEVRKHLPGDATIARLMPLISDDLSASTDPSGVRVYLKRFSLDASGSFPSRRLVGITPISHLQIARGEYLMYLEKDGYAPLSRTVSSSLNRAASALGSSTALRVEQKLMEASKVPDRMVFVPGGEYKLLSYGKPTEKSARLGDYFIDQFEVTNREYKEFIAAGGYLKKEFWKYPFVKDGKQLSWEQAMRHLLKDRTGLPGPRSWANQSFSEGKAQNPVTDITWYEAAAYAAFRGKQLPTVFQWEKASRIGTFTKFGWTMPWGLESDEMIDYRANFKTDGTAPVDSFEFGTSPYGAYNMAGNAAEWLLNRRGNHFATAGGSWGDPPYMFGFYGAFPGFYSSNRLGFRCVLNASKATGDQGAMRLETDEVPRYKPTSEASFNAWLSHYRYDKAPLNAKIAEVVDSAEWHREKITYDGANDERAMAYLYLPKNSQKPFQVINFIPGASAFYSLTIPQYVALVVQPYIQSGRAVFVVVLKGYVERMWPQDHKSSALSSVKHREEMVNWVTDVRRGLDYLETRSDIDAGKIAFLDISTEEYLIVPAIEPRYRSVVLMGYGLPKIYLHCIAEANPIYFAPHIRPPKLMLNGLYDEVATFKSTAEPLYLLLREPKRLEVYAGGHIAPFEIAVPIVNGWLDKTMGPVNRE